MVLKKDVYIFFENKKGGNFQSKLPMSVAMRYLVGIVGPMTHHPEGHITANWAVLPRKLMSRIAEAIFRQFPDTMNRVQLHFVLTSDFKRHDRIVEVLTNGVVRLHDYRANICHMVYLNSPHLEIQCDNPYLAIGWQQKLDMATLLDDFQDLSLHDLRLDVIVKVTPNVETGMPDTREHLQVRLVPTLQHLCLKCMDRDELREDTRSFIGGLPFGIKKVILFNFRLFGIEEYLETSCGCEICNGFWNRGTICLLVFQ